MAMQGLLTLMHNMASLAGWSNGRIHHLGMKWESEVGSGKCRVGNRDKRMNFTIFAEPDKFNICTHISTLFELDNIQNIYMIAWHKNMISEWIAFSENFSSV